MRQMIDNRTYPSIQIAGEMLDLAAGQNRQLTPMQLLKLAYLAHGWMLGLHDRPLIRENVLAWPYGPVIKELYRKVRRYGRHPVPKMRRDARWQPLDEDARHIVGEVFGAYGQLDGFQLSALTHADGTPWSATYGGTLHRDRVIDNDLIKAHFKELAAVQASS